MAELNRAYDVLRDEASRARFDRSRRVTISGVSVATTPTGPAPFRSLQPGSVLTFGRYAGWGLIPQAGLALALAPLVGPPLPDRDLLDPLLDGALRGLTAGAPTCRGPVR